jgi:hypothetical protein
MTSLTFRGLTPVIRGVALRQRDSTLFLDWKMVVDVPQNPCEKHKENWRSLGVRMALQELSKMKPEPFFTNIVILGDGEELEVKVA